MTTPAKLSLLWVFATVNYIFCDVFTLFNGPTLNELLTGSVGGIRLTEWFLFGFAAVLELPMAMIIGSPLLPKTISRYANIAVGLIMTIVQAGSLMAGSNTPHYYFFSVIEIGTTAAIIWIALRWRTDQQTVAAQV